MRKVSSVFWSILNVWHRPRSWNILKVVAVSTRESRMARLAENTSRPQVSISILSWTSSHWDILENKLRVNRCFDIGMLVERTEWLGTHHCSFLEALQAIVAGAEAELPRGGNDGHMLGHRASFKYSDAAGCQWNWWNETHLRKFPVFSGCWRWYPLPPPPRQSHAGSDWLPSKGQN